MRTLAASPAAARFGPDSTPRNCCMTKPGSPGRRHGPRSIEELPGVCAVEATHLHWRQDLRVQVSQVHAVQRARLGLQRFPMRHAPACCATHGLECLVALQARLGILRMAGNPDRAVFAVGPEGAHSPAGGTVAVRGLLRGGRRSIVTAPQWQVPTSKVCPHCGRGGRWHSRQA